jgi:predicted glycoside hydrolase/deacetylase ChbG (UPF0249 family)
MNKKSPIIKSLFLIGLLTLQFCRSFGQDEIRLLVRIDDMGFSHAANLACIDTYKNGVARSVEVIVPGPWFEEAVTLLNENPGLDVGVHLALTSEWKNLKWRPLTNSPSLTDKDGYFYPMIWKNDRFPEGSFLNEASWQLEEIEKELRAQIELALKKIPHTSHLSAHMGCMSMTAETRALLKNLALEYELDISLDESEVKRAPSWSGNEYSAKQKEDRFLEMLDQLAPGTWYTVEHPAYDVEELRKVGHTGYENVGADRHSVTLVLTSKRVQEAIEKKGIKLISYLDLKP